MAVLVAEVSLDRGTTRPVFVRLIDETRFCTIQDQRYQTVQSQDLHTRMMVVYIFEITPFHLNTTVRIPDSILHMCNENMRLNVEYIQGKRDLIIARNVAS
jgi:hypothetical protein